MTSGSHDNNGFDATINSSPINTTSDRTLEDSRRYWLDRLRDAPEQLSLPTDFPRPAQQDVRGALVPIALGPALSERLRALCASQGCTLHQMLLAAWAVVLSRLSQQRDVVIGTPSANRDQAQVHDLIGFFVNTLPLRLRLEDDPSVASLLRQAREVAVSAQDHQQLPFEQLVDLLRPVRRLDASPVFQVLLGWQNDGMSLLRLQDVGVERIHSGATMARYDLELILGEEPDGIAGSLGYATALFEEASIRRHAGYLQRVLEGFVQAHAAQALERTPAGRLGMLSPGERRHVLEALNRTEAASPPVCMHALFEAQAARTPDAVAVICGDNRVSYAALNRGANRVAHRLIAHGVRPDDRVALCMLRGVEMVMGLLGILKAGAAYVPLDPGYPHARLEHMMRDSAPKALLGHGRVEAAVLSRLAAAVEPAPLLLSLDADAPLWDEVERNDPDPRALGLAPGHLAYVIYTSGSTGRPKGVMIEHRNATNFLHWTLTTFPREQLRNMLFATSINFDLHVFELHAALSAGVEIVLSRDVLSDVHAHSPVDLINTVPSTLQTLLDLQQLPVSTRRVNLAGEPLARGLVERIFAQTDVLEVTNLYGPSETTTYSTWIRMPRAEGFLSGIGRPIANTRIYLLDPYGEPVPLGAVGEIHIGGAGVARGYLNQPALTAERFLPDPFHPQPGARMYRTGDLGRYRTDGTLDYLGRNDFQVKIRGFRIELGEIEAQLCACPGVREAVVIARGRDDGHKQLVAYLTGGPQGGALAVEAIRTQLQGALPEYMVPAAYVQLASLPLTPNGKLDRQALPAPAEDAYARGGHAPSQGTVEEAIATVWSQVLQVERVGRDDDFFRLGGNSLLGVMVMARLRERWSLSLSLSDLFEHNCVKALAARIEAALAAEEILRLPMIERAETSRRHSALPVSFAQERLWVLCQMPGHGCAYHMAMGVRLEGSLRVHALRRALDHVIRRHETLRSRFALGEDGVVQFVEGTDDAVFALREVDATELTEPQCEALADEHSRKAFDLERGPLLRGLLLRRGAQRHDLHLVQHHISGDGWSLGILAHELGALYAAGLRAADGEDFEDPLPALPIQYADYAVWQRRWFDAQMLEGSRRYWLDRLRDAPEQLSLPTDFPRPAQQDVRGALVPIALGPALSERLRALCASQGCTLHQMLLAAWAVVLSRLSQQRDVVIGTPSANRDQAQVHDLIGFFVNTLPLRLRLEDDPSVASLLRQAREVAVSAQDHQQLPFEQLVDLLRPVRRLDASPVFQVLLGWQNDGMSLLRLQDVGVERIHSGATMARYDLELILGEEPDGIAGSLGYATALFEEASIRRHAGYLQRVLEGFVQAHAAQALERTPAGRLGMLSPGERRHVLEALNRTEAASPPVCMHALFEAQAARTPDAVAVICGDNRVSYAALNRGANRVAHRLIAHGVRPDDRVALCMLRGVEMVMGLLGILKAGAAYVPLDPGYPHARLEHMMRDSAPKALLGHGRVEAAVLSRLAAAVEPAPLLLSLDADAPLWDEVERNDPDPRALGLAPGHLAYVIYTSGSTGRPKGVMIEHRNATNFLHWTLTTFPREQLRNMLFATSINFDLHVFELHAALSAGVEIVLSRDVLSDVHAHSPVDLINTVPSTLQTLLDLQQLPVSTRRVNLAGEPLARGLVERIFAQTDVLEVTNLYGPSETTTYSTWIRMPRAEGFLSGIGRPIANTRIYLLDPYGEPVPLGAVGEIHIGGAGVARGYLNQPALTAERFLPDPFHPQPGARMYRTGDLGRYRTDGTLDYLGRNDFQVKIRGFRIELGEIEAQLCACPGVREAVVIARGRDDGHKQLVAYLTGGPQGGALAVEAIRTQLQGALPEYMVPAAYVQLASLPLTPNGKLDRQALPAPAEDAYARGGHAPSQGTVEEAIATVWSQVLQVERVGRDDDFFRLGGNSLLGVMVMARLRERWSLSLSLSDLFEHNCVKALAARIEAALAAEEILRLPMIERAETSRRHSALPVSFAQERLWVLCQMPGHGCAYHMAMGVRLEGSLRVHALRRALDHVIRRHETLRSRFALGEDGVVQFVEGTDDAVFALREVDATELTEPQCEALADEHSRKAFDLERGPLLRGLLLRRGAQRHDLHLVQHHISGDGWSLGILAHELGALYAAGLRAADGEDFEDPLPALPIQYADYAVWQRRWFDAQMLEGSRRYWLDRLRDAPEQLSLPTDFPRPAQQDVRGALVPIALGPALSERLRALCASQGCTLHQMLLAAWAVVLSRLSQQRDVVIGTPSANRDQAQVHDLIGFFVNTLPLRLRLEDDPSVASLLRQAREVAVSAQDHQQLPFEQLVDLLRPVRRLDASPVFQVLLGWQNDGMSLLRLQDVGVERIHSGATMARYDLELILGEEPDGIAGSLGYATALFEEASIRRHAGYLQRVLEGFVQAHAAQALERTPAGRLGMLSPGERRHVLEALNRTEAASPPVCMHALFEAQAARTPDAVAVICGDSRVSYAALNRGANRVAHRLIAHGVRPDDRVALCMLRGVEMVMGLLGILKAGAAYVPLDPGYPHARLEHMMRDSAPKALLGHGRVEAAVLSRLAAAVEPAPLLLSLDADAPLWDEVERNDPDPRALGLAPGHLAYVIYTSGSTGRPKGVMTTHSNLVNLLQAAGEQCQLKPEDRFLQFVSVAFDVCVEEILTPLSLGACSVLRDESWLNDARTFWQKCEQYAVSVADLPVRFWEEFTEDDNVSIPACVRCIRIGGEVASQAGLRRWFGRSGYRPVLQNVYGPTETTVCTTLHPVTQSDFVSLPIGRPIANARIYLLDPYGEPVPLGAVGEIHIGGAGVARGYLNQPTLTAERFLPDPFHPQPGARMYRTGDLGRYRTDGTLDYLGRNDFQIKIRGFRIELGEIEAQLCACPGVREAVVIARGRDDGHKQLVAYLTSGPQGGALAVEAIRTQLQGALPEYMVPAAYVQLASLPLTPNGKLDRQALPAPAEDAYARDHYVPPQGPVEEAIATVWSQVLQVERVGRDDDFFRLGGHSLLAVKVMARLREAGVRIEISDLFGGTTLAALAARSAKFDGTARIPENRIPAGCERITPQMLPLVDMTPSGIDRLAAEVAGGAANIQDIYPLAPLQEGIFFHHLLSTQGDVYITPIVQAFDSRERLDRYVQALNAVIRRHDVLRTSVHWEGLPAAVQVVQRQAPLIVHEHALATDADRSGAEQLLSRFDPRHYRMDLRRAPLLELHAARDPLGGSWLLLTLSHHLWGDHESLELLRYELQAHLLGQESALPAPVPFRNYVALSRTGLGAQAHETFFRTMLGDVDEPTLPYGLMDVQGTGADIRESRHVLPSALSRRIRASARREGVSVATLFHLVWAQVLSKLSGREDVVFGTLLLGRMQGAMRTGHGMGLFINTLPLRVKLKGQGVRDALLQTRQGLAQLLEHEHASLALAQRCSGVHAPTPLFSALLNFRHSPLASQGDSQAPDVLHGIVDLEISERTNYPLSLNVDDHGADAITDAGFSLNVQIAATHAPERLAAYVQCAMENTLDALESAPESRIGALPVVHEAERKELLNAFCPEKIAHPPGGLVQRIQDWAERQPDALAVSEDKTALSYRALNECANRWARHLDATGLCREDRIVLALPRGIDLICIQLALLKLGAAYVPIDATIPQERFAMLMTLAFDRSDPASTPDAACLVLTTRAQALPAADSRGRVPMRIDIDAAETRRAMEHHSTDNLPPIENADALAAYVMFTSGSTGIPKGVEVSQSNIAALVLDQHYAQLDPAGRIAFTANPAFDASTFEIYAALLNGAALIVVDNTVLLDPDALGALLEREQVSVLHLVAGLFSNYAQTLAGKLAGIRYLLTGGDVVDVQACRVLQDNGRPQHLMQCYGPTETTTFATTFAIRSIPDDAVSLPIGRPIANARIYLLDPYGEPVPLGAVGEIHIGGAGVARGYLNQPALTAERFLPDPFHPQPGARMYRTGDLGRYRTDGTLDYLGRNDFQVKIRGFRIELGEIEAQLCACPGVREAVVIARGRDDGHKQLVAYLTSGPQGGALAVEAIRTQLQGALPEYMVPAAYVQLASLPLTPNGKLDRQALPAPAEDAYARDHYVPPQGPVEEAIATVWSQVLQVERVGRDDDFFRLGGHSLLAVKVMARLREAGVRIEISDLFGGTTLAALAARSAKFDGTTRIPENRIPAGCERITPQMLPLVDMTPSGIDRLAAEVTGGAANIQDIYPLAPLQEGIFFHHLLSTQGDVYITPIVQAFDSRERLDRYVQALNAVIRRHDVLRTSVHWEGLPAAVQVVQRQAPLTVHEHALATDADRSGAEQLLSRFDPRHYRMDLRRAPLLELHAARDPLGGSWLLLTLSHHLWGDHESLELLRYELQAHLLGQESALPAPVPFRNYVALSRTGLGAQAHETFFRTMLGDVDEPTLPYGLMDVQGTGADIRESRHVLPSALSRRIRASARREGVSVATLFHLVWAQVLSKLSGREDVVFGTVLLGRIHSSSREGHGMGLFINTLPLRVKLKGQGVRDALLQTRQGLAQLLEHEHASLALAQRCSGVHAPTPLFSALLNFRHSPLPPQEDAMTSDPMRGIQFVDGYERSNYPISLDVDDHGTVAGEDHGFSIKTQLLAPQDATRLAGYVRCAMENTLDALENSPNLRASKLRVVPERESNPWQAELHRPVVAYPQDYLHSLFEWHAAETPEAEAIICGENRLGYGELNRRSNQLAHRLIALGVHPEDRVAICMQRRIEMAVGFLAILKAGAVYVPLDPEFPRARLGHMLRDCAPSVLLAHDEGDARLLNTLIASMGTENATPTVLSLAPEAPHWQDPDHGNPDPRAFGLTASHLAYVIYTSGSTGTPKGVLNHHAGLRNLAWCEREHFQTAPGHRVLQFASFCFDTSISELSMTLAHGATLVLADRETRRSTERLLHLIREQSVTHATLPPAFVALLPADAELPLTHLIMAGETCPPGLAAHWAARMNVFNAYGPTETTVCVAAHRCEAQMLARVPIGRPHTNTRIYLLDPYGEPVPLGAVGEIHIGGAGVARGYLNQPALTAERFLPDPFHPQPGARMYRTGDLGRYRTDGTLDYLGRNDFQVKIRGFRIELGEIEAQLCACPGVREAVVIARGRDDGHKQLVAYLTSGPQGGALAVEAIRTQLQGALPEYMVPAAYVQLASLPLTSNGKLDRQALPAPAEDAYARDHYVPPQGPVEEAIATVWSQVLQVERVGRDDDFFRLGGHSLLAMTLQARLAHAGHRLNVSDIYRTPTVAGQAVRLKRTAGHEDPVRSIVTVQESSHQGPPLFLLHEVSGTESYFSVLGMQLDANNGVCGILGVPLTQSPLDTMAALGARAAEIIQRVQPEGSCRLAGWCFGGELAYATAIVLARSGRHVEYLGLIDAQAGRHRAGSKHVTLCQLLMRHIEMIGGAVASTDFRDNALAELQALSDSGDFEAMLARVATLELYGHSPLALLSPEQAKSFFEREAAHIRAEHGHAPESSDIPLHLYIARERSATDPGAMTMHRMGAYLGWDRIVAPDRITVTHVPGDHHSMLQKDGALAAAMNQHLRTLRGRPSSGNSAGP